LVGIGFAASVAILKKVLPPNAADGFLPASL
jgi:hypothetical protein